MVTNIQLLSPWFLFLGSVCVTFSSAGVRETPSLSPSSMFLTKQLRSPQLELLFHKDLLEGADGKNGGYIAKKNYTGCQSKFILVSTSSAQRFRFSSANMLLKPRYHFKARFWKTASVFHWQFFFTVILSLLPSPTENSSVFPHHLLWKAFSFRLRNLGPNLPGKQLCPGFWNENSVWLLLPLNSQSSVPFIHKRRHLILQELRTDSLNLASSGQAETTQATCICKRKSPPAFLTVWFKQSEPQA